MNTSGGDELSGKAESSCQSLPAQVKILLAAQTRSEWFGPSNSVGVPRSSPSSVEPGGFLLVLARILEDLPSSNISRIVLPLAA